MADALDRIAYPKRPALCVEDDVVAVLARAGTNGDTLVLPAELERRLYVRVDKVLAAAGGHWNRWRAKHVFAGGDAAAAIEPILVTGTLVLPPDLGWFATPPGLAAELVRRSGARPGSRLLEPSAGEGAIVLAALAAGARVAAMEIDPLRFATLFTLADDPTRLLCQAGDFLAQNLLPNFDQVVMNPPFAPRRTDVFHVRHALGSLRPGGRLVAVMSAGTLFRADRETDAFRDLVCGLGGTIEPLPDDSFAASGTHVRTVVVTVDKPRPGRGFA